MTTTVYPEYSGNPLWRRPSQVLPVSLNDTVALIQLNRRTAATIEHMVGRVLIAMAERRISVLLMSQSSADGNFCFVIPRTVITNALDMLHTAFREDLSRGSLGSINARTDVVLVTVHGTVQQSTLQTYLHVSHHLAAQHINVLINAQGFSGQSASLVVEVNDPKTILAALRLFA